MNYDASAVELMIEGENGDFVLQGPDTEKTPQTGSRITTFVTKGSTYSVIRVGSGETAFTITPGNTDLDQNNL